MTTVGGWDRFWYVGRIEHVVVRLGNGERRMWPVQRHVQEPGITPIHQILDVVDGGVHHECRLGLVGREGWRRPRGSPPGWNLHVISGAQKPGAVRDVVSPALQPPVPGVPMLG